MKIKIFKKQDPLGGAEVYLYDEKDRATYVVKPLTLTMFKVEEGGLVEPTFKMPEWEVAEFLKSMAELAEELGVKTDKQLQLDTKNQGVLDATKFHLEDMRTLVFKSK